MSGRGGARKTILSGAAASFLMGNSAGVAGGRSGYRDYGNPEYLTKDGDGWRAREAGGGSGSGRGAGGGGPSSSSNSNSRTSSRCSTPRHATLTRTKSSSRGSAASSISSSSSPSRASSRGSASGRSGTAKHGAVASNTGSLAGKGPCDGGEKKKLCCDKCDKAHATVDCPFYRKGRDKHPDAQKRRHHDFGEAGGNFVLRGARVIRQPGDGSCLFHSMAYGLRRAAGVHTSATQLRREIAQFLQRNAGMKIAESPLGDWVKWDTGQTVAAYAKRMMGGNYWGGGIEIACCVRMNKVNIHVYEARRERGAFKRISCFNCPGAKQTAHVLYTGGIHYDALAV